MVLRHLLPRPKGAAPATALAAQKRHKYPSCSGTHALTAPHLGPGSQPNPEPRNRRAKSTQSELHRSPAQACRGSLRAVGQVPAPEPCIQGPLCSSSSGFPILVSHHTCYTVCQFLTIPCCFTQFCLRTCCSSYSGRNSRVEKSGSTTSPE